MNARSLTSGEDSPLSYKMAIVQSVIANLEQRTAGSQRTSFVGFFSCDIMVRWMELYISFQPICKLYSEIGT